MSDLYISEPEGRRRIHVSDSQLADLVDQVAASKQLKTILETRFNHVETRMQNYADRMIRLEDSIAVNTTLTQSTAADTKEMKEILEMGKVLFKFADGFGRFVRWTAGVAAALVALWALLKDSGKLPWH